jgi:hypothetical protein
VGHGWATVNKIKGPEVAPAQYLSMVGAVGIEPTTPAV